MNITGSGAGPYSTGHVKAPVPAPVRRRRPQEHAVFADAPEQSQPAVLDGYWHTTHPETGLEVVFVPGEALPAWAATAHAAQEGRRSVLEAAGETGRRTRTGKGSVSAAEADT